MAEKIVILQNILQTLSQNVFDSVPGQFAAKTLKIYGMEKPIL